MEIDINELINNLIQKIAILELENSKKDVLINQLQNEVNNIKRKEE